MSCLTKLLPRPNRTQRFTSGATGILGPMLRAAALALLPLALALPAAASNDAAAKSVTIRVLVAPATKSITDVAPKTFRATGDYTRGDTVKVTLTLRNYVRQFGKPKGARVGTSRLVATALSSQKVRGDIVTKFPAGTVHARGVGALSIDEGSTPPKVPIIGGTGIYAGATGFVEGRPLASGAHLNIYRLQVP